MFGSSWSKTPSAQIITFLRDAPWLQLHARDRISKDRMEASLDREIPLVADLAFLLRPEICSPEAQVASRWIAARQTEGATLLGVNMSDPTLRGAVDQGIDSFVSLIGDWLEVDSERAILLMPHDSRPGFVGDMEVLKRLHQVLAGRFAERMHFLPASLDAWELKAVAGMMDLILTGRMHLAIAAMGMGTPALCTVYQDKFEGLMDHFGVEGLTMSVDDVLAARAGALLDSATARKVELAARIQARLPAIMDLSRKNFAGM